MDCANEKAGLITPANILTLARIVLSFALISLQALSAPFLAIYALCGLTDMLDGPVARKTGTASAFGARLDSVADLVLVAVALAKVLPVLPAPLWAWIAAGLVVLTKVINLISGIATYGKPVFPHTIANKAAGAVLFLTVFLLPWIPVSVACFPGVAFSLFAAMQEGHLIRTGKAAPPQEA